ncbi:S8 family serine peptidase [Marinimicrobium sp. ARAG 43.8]|uniref:S8 family serine peptidase n=1 Tax=Marinimicrobium sp. ARAG 43.8 TaxID=3418719 RepID=UPI003CF54A16
MTENVAQSDEVAPNEPRPDRSQTSTRERVSSDELDRSESRQSAERQRKEVKSEEVKSKEVKSKEVKSEKRKPEARQPRENQPKEPLPEEEKPQGDPSTDEQTVDDNSESVPDSTGEESVSSPTSESAVEPDAKDEPVERPAVAQPVRTRPLIQRGGSLISQALPPPPPEPPERPSRDPVVSGVTPHAGNTAYEPDELLLTTLDMDEARTVARQFSAYSLRIKSREQLPGLGLVMTRFRLPPGENPLPLLRELQRDYPDLNLDTNQRYHLMNGRRRYARTLIHWPANAPWVCRVQARIGMIDTVVDASHPALEGRALQVRTFTRGTSADDGHGTAVAALFIGNGAEDIEGLLPAVELLAANVFRQRDEQVETTTDSILQALDWLITEQVRAINVSLGGEHNAVLELALQQVLSRGIVVLAAAGNEGADGPPVYPAAQSGVLAITAVDALEQLYTQANRGDYVDYAAPGVDVWSASGSRGGYYHSGTSFAVPFATAAWLLADAAGEDLAGWAKDLGPAGRDAQFGRGLLQVGPACRAAP